MSKNIVEIDLGDIDIEIQALQKKIDVLNGIKDYATQRGVSPIATPSNSASTQAPPGKLIGVSEFILNHLKQYGKVDTKSIIMGFAFHLQKDYAEVSGNVSNALSRLKTDGKINSQQREGGRKAGSLWFINTPKE